MLLDSNYTYTVYDDEIPSAVERLPCELWAAIFSYFHPVDDKLPRLALVCRKWRLVLYKSSELWRHLNIIHTNYSSLQYRLINHIFNVYGYHIEHLVWSNGSRVYESSLHAISNLSNLKVIRLPILWNKSVIECLAPLKRLKVIYINGGFELQDSDLLLILAYFRDVRRITLHGCWGLTSQGVETFLNRLDPTTEVKLKLNTGLPLRDYRSDRAMLEGGALARSLADCDKDNFITVISFHFVPIELETLWSIVNSLPRLRKLSVSNCEGLYGIRLRSESLQKVYLLHLWSALFVSIHAPNLRSLKIDEGLESMEHLEIESKKLRDVYIDGSGILRTVHIKSNKLKNMEIFNCPLLDSRSLVQSLSECPTLCTLRIGDVGVDDMSLDESFCSGLQTMCLLEDYSSKTLRVRCRGLRAMTTQDECEIQTLNDVLIMAEKLKKISLVGVPNLRNLIIQCESLDKVELNVCSDNQVCLETCIIQAIHHVGFLRFFDCVVRTLILSTPSAGVVVLYRCQIGDYVLEMALNGCPNITHLNLERCSTLTKIRIPMAATLMRYINLFGCHNMLRVEIDCHELLAINLGDCPSVRLYLNDVERNLAISSLNALEFPHIVLPDQMVRWNHQLTPQLCS
ncbi:uncharacterized protein LOC102808468 [Saccoglossus kowalevskii]|uniref:Uncharacterized protein LOC102808468 n=1 Tax=Saccoglossus kowalevskii TaxID=10224 RepID=A0ABM0MMK8_SACKO|nr:PREDICTED: uncharacterized protein LOC102808468 [Saccoglossus kowalevskii]